MKNEVNKEKRLDNELEISECLKEPPLYQIIMHNDPFTPMEFVVTVLERFFFMDRKSAIDTMMNAHLKGKAVCGFYSKDFAEAKIDQVNLYAKSQEQPLLCSMEAA